MKNFIEREYEEVSGGYVGQDGFYYTPNGSFWDADYVYFNREGYDKHGGYYDDNYQYVPGVGWDHINQGYKNEIEAYANYEDDCGDDLLEGEYFGDFDELEGELFDDPNIEVVKIIKGSNTKDPFAYEDYSKGTIINSYSGSTQYKETTEKNSYAPKEIVQEIKKEVVVSKEHKKNKLDDLFSNDNKKSDSKSNNPLKPNEKLIKQAINKKESETTHIPTDLNTKKNIIQESEVKFDATEKVKSGNDEKKKPEEVKINKNENSSINKTIEETYQVLNELDINKVTNFNNEINYNNFNQERNQYSNNNFQNRNNKPQNNKYNKHQNYNDNNNFNQYNYQNPQGNFNLNNVKNVTDYNYNDANSQYNNNQNFDNNKFRNQNRQTQNKYDSNAYNNNRNANTNNNFNNFNGDFPNYNNNMVPNFNYVDNNQGNNFPQMPMFNYQQMQGYYNPAMMMQQYYQNNNLEYPSNAYPFPNQNINENMDMNFQNQNYQQNLNRNNK